MTFFEHYLYPIYARYEADKALEQCSRIETYNRLLRGCRQHLGCFGAV